MVPAKEISYQSWNDGGGDQLGGSTPAKAVAVAVHRKPV